MVTGSRILYEFGTFSVDPDKHILLRDHQIVSITPKVFETLLILVRRSGEVVTKDDLMKELWPDAFVEEANLSQNIFMLRKALGDTSDDRRHIITVPGRGYRFTADVRTVNPDGDTIVIASHMHSQIIVDQAESETNGGITSRPADRQARMRWAYAIAIAVGVLVAVAVVPLRRPRRVVFSEKDPVLIGDFTNATGDPVFDETLRQGLMVQLEQSPFLSFIPEDRIRHTLQMMGRAKDERMLPELAREVCTRIGGAALLDGSITTLGSSFVVGLRAIDCRTGAILDEEQAQAAKKEDVLSALTHVASRFRTRVGESLATIKEHDTPLEEATTPSLDALKAYSMGRKLLSSIGAAAALPFFERAIAIDSGFAMAYGYLGRVYGELGESTLSAENTAKAYQVRDHTGDAEKFWIAAAYDVGVTENLERARQTCEIWERTYPHDPVPSMFLAGIIYPVFGKYQPAVEEAKKALKIDPDFAITYYILAERYQEIGLLSDAEDTLAQAAARKAEIPDLLLTRYDLAFLRGDTQQMDRISTEAQADASADEWVTQHAASAVAYIGHVRSARTTARHAEDLALKAGHGEAAALYKSGTAVWEAFVGNAAEAKSEAADALKMSKGRGVEYGAALAMALSGETVRAQQLADDLDRRFPNDTSVQFSYLPTLRAQLALDRGEAAKALELSEKAVPNELGTPRSAIHANFGAMYPAYLRGESYLALHKGAAAAREFRKILDHRGVVVSDPEGALAHLQLGRAYAMFGERDRARSAYQEFLILWKDADPDVPILKQAEAEYTKLK
jgi:eukaryotic-like serine/threonine-protein kinase